MILTAPSGKRGVVSTLRLESATTECDYKGGSVGNPFNSFREAQFSPQSFCRASLKSKLNGGQNGY